MWRGIKSALGRSRCRRWRSRAAWSGWLQLCGSQTHERTLPPPPPPLLSALSSSPHPKHPVFYLPTSNSSSLAAPLLYLFAHSSYSFFPHIYSTPALPHHPDFTASFRKTVPSRVQAWCFRKYLWFIWVRLVFSLSCSKSRAFERSLVSRPGFICSVSFIALMSIKWRFWTHQKWCDPALPVFAFLLPSLLTSTSPWDCITRLSTTPFLPFWIYLPASSL